MRLINTATLEIGEFFGSAIPRYAILSHRWEAEEVNFQDITNGREVVRRKRGWMKVQNFCAWALQNGHKYGWMDTCCIDKTSSSELSEAINSMYKWYARADICYAYLNDVSWRDLSDRSSRDSALRGSEWFARGWTLQELLAPREVSFVSKEWEVEVGTKDSLSSIIHSITSIPEHSIRHFLGATTTRPGYVNASCVAEIFSWAAGRETTREEDIAYSLMGILGIHMPLLYGEGHAAFRRLQHEILRMSDDESLFAHSDQGAGLLARTVDTFARWKGKGITVSPWDRERPEYAMTNKGLRIEPLLQLEPEMSDRSWDCYSMPLNCQIDGGKNNRVSLILGLYKEEGPSRGYWKEGFEMFDDLDQHSDRSKFERRVVYIPHRLID